MAPVAEALRACAPHVETRAALTGQHTDLVDQVLDAFRIITLMDEDWGQKPSE